MFVKVLWSTPDNSSEDLVECFSLNVRRIPNEKDPDVSGVEFETQDEAGRPLRTFVLSQGVSGCNAWVYVMNENGKTIDHYEFTEK